MQYARPTSDISIVEMVLSSGATAFTLLDESNPSDSDYVNSDVASTVPSVKVGLSSVTDPVSSTDHALRVRIAYESGILFPSPLPGTFTIKLFSGATEITSRTEVYLGSYSSFTYTLTAGEADAIADYTNLSAQVSISKPGATDVGYISWIELQVPYVAGAGSFEISEAYLGSVCTFMHDKPGVSGYGQQDMVRVRIQNSKEWQGNERMKGDDPIDEQDAMNGGICSLSGQWFPGHSLVTVRGKRYGRPYAPMPEQNRKGIPRLPGD